MKKPGFFFIAVLLYLLGFFVLALRMKNLSKTLEEKKPVFLKFLKLEFFNRFVSYVFPLRFNIPAKAIAKTRKKTTMLFLF